MGREEIPAFGVWDPKLRGLRKDLFLMLFQLSMLKLKMWLP